MRMLLQVPDQGTSGPHARNIAAKVLIRGVTQPIQPKQRRRNEMEAKIHASLSHPNIVQCFGHSVKGSFVLLMELCKMDLQTLKNDHTPGRKFGPEPTRTILWQVCSGLEYLRRQGDYGTHREHSRQKHRSPAGGHHGLWHGQDDRGGQVDLDPAHIKFVHCGQRQRQTST